MFFEKIKLVHVVDRLGIGGMENGVINICNLLNRNQFDSFICCINGLGEMAERLRDDVKITNMKFSGKNYLLYIFKLMFYFRKEQIDIVHTHGWGAGSPLGILAAKFAHVPVVINGEHGSFFTNKHQLLLQRFLFHLCDYNLSVSESLKKKLSKTLNVPDSKITVIRNGVDTSKFHGNYSKPQVIKKLSEVGCYVSPHTFNVFIIGSLKPEKDQITLLKAVKRLLDKSKQIVRDMLKLFIVGDGPDRTKLQNYVAANGLHNTVFFLGNRSDVPELLSIAHLLVSTSIARHEGLSNVMLEAMSSGVPVIATDSVGSKEIVKHDLNGYLVKEGDYAKLADHIEKLFFDEEKLAILGKNAKATIEQNFTMNSMIHNYEELYLQAIKKLTT